MSIQNPKNPRFAHIRNLKPYGVFDVGKDVSTVDNGFTMGCEVIVG